MGVFFYYKNIYLGFVYYYRWRVYIFIIRKINDVGVCVLLFDNLMFVIIIN